MPRDGESRTSLLSEGPNWGEQVDESTTSSQVQGADRSAGKNKQSQGDFHSNETDSPISPSGEFPSTDTIEGEIFRAYLLAQGDDYDEDEESFDRNFEDEETTPSQGSSTDFGAVKAFWTNYLDHKDSESLATDDSSRPRKTLVGSDVPGLWSSRSWLSADEFKGVQTPTASAPITPHSVSSVSESEEAVPRRKKVAISDTFKTSLSSQSQDHLKLNTGLLHGAVQSTSAHRVQPIVSETKLSPRPQPQKFLSSSPTLVPPKNSTPRSFGGDVTNISHSTSGYSQKEISCTIKSSNSLNSKIDKISATAEIEFSLAGKGKAGCSLAGTKKQNKGGKLLEVDPLIEIRIPSIPTPDSVSSSVQGRMQIPIISPRSEHQERFQWAYDAWCQSGLMKKNPMKRGISAPVASLIASYQKQSPPEVLLPRRIQTPRSEPKKIPETKWNAINTVKPQSSLDPLNTAVVRMSSGESEEPHETDKSTFHNLLKQWRHKSDDKPNSHFLSPEHKLELQLLESSLERSINKNEIADARKPNDTSLESVESNTTLVTKRIKEFNRDYFDLVREQDSLALDYKTLRSMKEKPGVTGSAPTIRRAATFGDEQPNTMYLRYADEIVDSDYYEDSFMEDEPSRALVFWEKKNTFEVLVGDANGERGHDMMIRNVERIKPKQIFNLKDNPSCECSNSVFSGNDDLIDFFLPKMGMACTCGKQGKGLENPEVPTAIENVLRPWQVEFLKSFGIDRGEQLVKARHRSGDVMAKALRQWRKKAGMTPFKTSCCGMAIHIWAKTCKAFVRSIRKQLASGNLSLDQQPRISLPQLTYFLCDLPAAPRLRETQELRFEPGSQEEI